MASNLVMSMGGNVFTSGKDIESLIKDASHLNKEYGFISAANYVVEGVTDASDA